MVLAVNKVDNDNREFNTPEFYQLGMGDPTPISAYHNYGIYDLMERVLSTSPASTHRRSMRERVNGTNRMKMAICPP